MITVADLLAPGADRDVKQQQAAARWHRSASKTNVQHSASSRPAATCKLGHEDGLTCSLAPCQRAFSLPVWYQS